MTTVAQLPNDLTARVQKLPEPRRVERVATVPWPFFFLDLGPRIDDREAVVRESPKRRQLSRGKPVRPQGYLRSRSMEDSRLKRGADTASQRLLGRQGGA